MYVQIMTYQKLVNINEQKKVALARLEQCKKEIKVIHMFIL